MLVPRKSDASSKQIHFAGYTWLVSNANQPVAPGPNFWNNQNAFVDQEGKLHLRLTKNEATGLWSAAEIISQQMFGTGTYEFFVEGHIDQLDKNVVFGIFQYSGVDMHDEIDIEYSKWGDNGGTNLTYSVWPKEGIKAGKWSSENTIRLEGTHTTQRMIRSDSEIQFLSLHGFRSDDKFAYHIARCKRKRIITNKPMPLYLNLWLFRGKPPSNAREVEIIIHKFSFTPTS